MKLNMNNWSPQEAINAYVEFIKFKKSKKTHINYIADKYGFKETMEGEVEITNPKLKELGKKINYETTKHVLSLSQNDWKIEFNLRMKFDPEEEHISFAELNFDESIKKEVLNHFKEFDLREQEK